MGADNQSSDTGDSHEMGEILRSELPAPREQDLAPEPIEEDIGKIPQAAETPLEGVDGDKETWKLLMVNQLNALAIKIRTSTSEEDFLAVESGVKNILQQLEPTKTLPLGTDGRRELGISLLESLSNIILFNLLSLNRNRQYLDIACHCSEAALSFLPRDHVEIAEWIFNAARCFQLRFELAGALEDIESAVVGMSTALRITPPGHPQQLFRVEALAVVYQRRWTRLYKSEDFQKAMENFSLAYNLAAKGSAIIPALFTKMAELYFSWSQAHKNEVQALDAAIECQKSAVNLTSETDERLPGYIQRLGRFYHLKFNRLGSREDIESAIDAQTKTLQLIRHDNFAKLNVMNDLGDSYGTRFAYLGDLEDCNRSIELHEQVISLATEANPNMAQYLSSLGNAYMERFSYIGNMDDLGKAFEYQSQAVSLTTQGDQNLPGRLNNLGLSYRFRFHYLGKLEDINKAIELQGSAARLLEDAQVGRNQPTLFGNLGNSFQSRFSRLHRDPDIESAISIQTKAVEATPDDHPTKPGLLDNLGTSYEFRFEHRSRLHNLNDINRAIEYKTRAVHLTPEGHRKLATFLNNLGLVHQIRFLYQNSEEDNERAIEYLSRAVALTPDGHSDKPQWLNNLGNAYKERFRVGRHPQDFGRALEALSQAVSLTGEGHANIPIMLTSLALLHSHQFEQSGSQDALNNSVTCLRKSIKSSHGQSAKKFDAARFLARLLSSNNQPGAIHAYQIAMDCLPQIIWLGEIASVRLAQTFQLSDLVEEAAAVAIQSQDIHLALEWLEQGRSIVWGQFLQLQTPLDDLTSVNPELATKLKEASDELHNTSTGIIPPENFEPDSYLRPLDWIVQRHHLVADHYDKLLDQVRQTPGFESFLRPRKASELIKAARSQPVVVINVHKSRCDALILLPNESDIIHVPLSNLYERRALKLHVPFDILPKSSQAKDELDGFRGVHPKVEKDQFEIMLGELWVCVAKPILEALGMPTDQPPEELKHIIWNTTGPLSLLPLHAAGDYTQPGMRLYEFAISSYIPMLGVLLRATQATPAHSRILAVGQEMTPGQAPLPSTKQELGCIKAHAKEPIQYLQLDGSNATVPAVISAMEEYDWVHLACHAYQLPQGPLGSSFRLYEGELKLMQILQKHFRNKGLAFLSACQTAAGEELISNESAHLASGMLIAGYPSVIATMWAIRDQDAPLVADRVYARLIKDGVMDYKEAASALHRAVGELRERVGEKAFMQWAPFIHIGS
ncbi:unnamed protein product [Rhizoctonia solani]|uniref:CHAT domain-containing protein n=1 Tax=Rhizoctonia solani TaxID=456999 RepID=A0A8H3CYB8_9AGAM|nr:unnamed protein product [Rhizoctonia solani]